MKSIISLFITIFLSLHANGQIFVDVSKTKKVKKDGIEVTLFQDKPFTGNITESYPNGNPKSNISLKDGITNGLWQEWYENGKLKFNAYWLNGKGHGLWEYYHENGVLRQEEFYNMDIPIGIFRDCYNNGQIKVKSSWLNGKKHGFWTYYSEFGILTKTELYDNNNLISTK
jgi:antitoxin component YwqK of YwqJK toxin-antitoxin module